MAIIFSDYFNSGSLTGWKPHGPPGTSLVNLWGYGNTYCVGCNTSQEQKLFASPITTGAGSIRVQLAAILTTIGAIPDGIFVLNVQDYNAGSLLHRFQMLVYIRQDGALRVRLPDHSFGAPAYITSSAGVFPVDGVQRGLQVTFTLVAGTLNANFYVNNVSVWTFSFTPFDAWRADVWDNVFIYPWRVPIGGPPLTDITTHDNFEVDDSNASVAWPNGTAPTLDLNRTCFLDPPAPGNGVINVTKATIPSGSSTSFHVVTSGSGLSDFDFVDGETVSFNVASGSGYSFAEDAANGFVTTYLVSNGSPHTNVTVAANEIVNITITNASSLGGIYQVTPDKTNDTLYVDNLGSTSNFPIPNPFAITALIGDE